MFFPWHLGGLCFGRNEERGDKDDLAAKLISKACLDKFPRKPSADENPVRELTEAEILKLGATASLKYGNHLGGDIYNGNEHLTLSEVEIGVTTTNAGVEQTRIYRDQVRVPPLSAVDFGFNVMLGDPGTARNWSIAGARGREIRGHTEE